MITIEVKERGRWRRLPNGPFPITEAQLTEARKRFAEEQSKATTFAGARMAPVTTARQILSEIAPALDSFDLLNLGFAVTIQKVRVTECAF